jgi:hypothetical protein
MEGGVELARWYSLTGGNCISNLLCSELKKGDVTKYLSFCQMPAINLFALGVTTIFKEKSIYCIKRASAKWHHMVLPSSLISYPEQLSHSASKLQQR